MLMSLMDQIRRIERLDQLIRLKSTGSPKELAQRLGISKKTLYNTLNFMKNEGAKIYFSTSRQSFCYEKDIYFYFGFSMEKVQLKQIRGGKRLSFFSECNFFTPLESTFASTTLLRDNPKTLPL